MAPTSSQQTIRARLKSGGVWALLGKLVATALAFLGSALLTRMLPAADVGAYFFILNLVVVLVAVAQFGLPHATVRLMAETGLVHAPPALGGLLCTILGLALLACALTAAGFFVVVHFLAGRVAGFDAVLGHWGTVVAWVTAAVISSVLAEGFRGLHDIRAAAVFGAILPALLSYLLLLGVWFAGWRVGLDDTLDIALGAVSLGLAVTLGVAAARFGLLARRREIGPVALAHVVGTALPIWGVNVLSFSLSQLDVVILGMFRDGAEVAVYGAVTRLVALVTLPLVVVNLTISPLIAELHVQGRAQELQSLLRRSATLAGVPSVLVLAAFVLGGGRLLGLVYGSAYVGGASLLVVLSLGQIVNAWTGSCGTSMLMTGHQKPMLAIMTACGGATLLACLLLAPGFGALGIAVAIATGIALQNLAMMLVLKARVGIWTCIDPRYLVQRMAFWQRREPRSR